MSSHDKSISITKQINNGNAAVKEDSTQIVQSGIFPRPYELIAEDGNRKALKKSKP